MTGRFREKSTGRIFGIRVFLKSDIVDDGIRQSWMGMKVHKSLADDFFVEVPPNHIRCYLGDAIAMSVDGKEARILRADQVADQFDKVMDDKKSINYNDPTEDDLNELFSYHSPSEEQTIRYERLRAAGKEYARLILQLCPQTPDRTSALRAIREAGMWANASIALGGDK